MQGDNRLSWTNHGKCMDLDGGSLADGNRVSITFTSTILCRLMFIRSNCGAAAPGTRIRFGTPATASTISPRHHKMANMVSTRVALALIRRPTARLRGSSMNLVTTTFLLFLIVFCSIAPQMISVCGLLVSDFFFPSI
jgi:hypothetical protein